MQLNATDPWSFIRGFQSYSFCDWPAKVSCVIFLGSCNLRCPTCHNSQLAWKPETLPLVSREKIFAFLDKNRKWLDGIVISGGEPTCTPGLDSFLSELAAFDQPIKLDTNGLRPDIIKDLLEQGLVQMLSVDIKGPWRKYPLLTGNRCSMQQAGDSLQEVIRMSENYNCRFQFRCTKVPDLTEEDIREVRSLLPGNHELTLQDYIPVQAL